MAKAFVFNNKGSGVDFEYIEKCELKSYDVYYLVCSQLDLLCIDTQVNPILFLPTGMRMLLRCRCSADNKLYKDTAIGVSVLEKSLDQTDLYYENRLNSAFDKLGGIYPKLDIDDFKVLTSFIVKNTR